jgi:uncharacterized repeat protein (TIGR01451 family)
MKSLQQLISSFMACLALLALSLPASAQTVYGVGGTATNCTSALTSVFTVNATTGVATSVGTLSFASAAASVSPIDGLVYYLEQNVASPRLASWNPSGGANNIIGTTALPATMIRMGFAPDGRLYAATNTNLIYELNPATGATVRTITPGIPVGGSGDMAFTSNGDLYVIANDTAGTIYQLWRLTAAQITAGGTQTATQIGANLGSALNNVALNGLAEIPPTGSCTVSPCFAMSSGATNVVYLVNGVTGSATAAGGTATTLGAPGVCLTDLGRGFFANIALTKTDNRNSLHPGDTTVYSIVATNTGPATVPLLTIQDPAVSGLTCTSVTCATTGSAVCPTTLTIAALQGAGVVTGVMPANSTVTLSLTCTVN